MTALKDKLENRAFACLILSAFAAAFSLPAGRAFLAVSLVLAIAFLITARRLPAVGVSTWLCLAYVAVLVPATVFGVRPDLGIPKLPKWIWFVGIPLTAVLVNSPKRLAQLLGAYALGTGVLCAWRCVRHPIAAHLAARDGLAPSFRAALVDTGSMTDGQRIMLGILIAAGFILLCKRERIPATAWWLLFALQWAALILNFKRGSWLCAAGLVGVFAATRMNWKYSVALLIVIAASLALTPVRSRLAELKEEFNVKRGGRLVMWTKVAPGLIRQYPWFGRGERETTNLMMRRIARNVERNRNHLHSNFLQVPVSTGLVGFAVYLAWMGAGFFEAIRFARRARAGPASDRVFSFVLLLMLAGLLLNGLVEYNLGDAELVLAYGFIMGAAGAGVLRRSEPGSAPPVNPSSA